MVECLLAARATVLFSTDDFNVGGHGRVAHQSYAIEKLNESLGRFLLYMPSRCATVFHL